MTEMKNAYRVHPDEIKPDDHYCYVVVAVVGYGHDWAAYRGLADWSPERVADEGDKLAEEAAGALFPTLAATLRYRS